MASGDLKTWVGSPPVKCDVCGDALPTTFIDGRTKFGIWGVMDMDCHRLVGVGVGPGKGQKYERRGKVWIKVEG
jgi:hypothetical protein